MSYVTWRLERLPFEDNNYDPANLEILEDFRDPLLQRSLGDSRNTFEFKLRNFAGRADGRFNVRDRISIFRISNSDIATSTDLLMEGAIEEEPYTKSVTMDELHVKGFDFSESVLSALSFVDAELKTPPEAIQEAIRLIALYNANFNVIWHPNNPLLKQDGSAFPFVGKQYFYRPIRFMLEEWSKNQITQDGLYYWFVDRENRLVWRPINDSPVGVFNDSITPFHDLTIQRDVKDVINFIIVKGGTTPNGTQIQFPYFDMASIGKNGFKEYIYVDDNKVAAELNKIDLVGTTESRYPEMSTAYTTKWRAPTGLNKVVSGVTITSNQYITIDIGSETNNRKAYNDVLKEVVTYILSDKAQSLIDLRANGKVKYRVGVSAGQLPWLPGHVITSTLKILGRTVQLRVTDAQFSSAQDVFTLEEDVGSL